MQPGQERQLVQQAQRNPQAFVHLYDAYFSPNPRLRPLSCLWPRNAEDLIADVFLRALHRLPDFQWRRKGSFSAWLFRIAHNRVIDYYRQRERPIGEMEQIGDLEDLSGQAPKPDEVLAQQETFERLRALISTLSPRRQEVITLRFFGGLRNYEIAQILGLDQRTVAATSSRGLQDLKGKYAAETDPGLVAEVLA